MVSPFSIIVYLFYTLLTTVMSTTPTPTKPNSSFFSKHQSLLVQLLVFLAYWAFTVYMGVGAVGFCVGALYMIFTNLGEKKDGELSAYSVFNTNNRKLPGTFDASQIDSSMRSGGSYNSSSYNDNRKNDDRNTHDDYIDPVVIKYTSKQANMQCSCGSGKKIKKCCRSFVTYDE